MRAHGHEAGFTLLETLTALAILAIALVALFDAHQRGMRAAGVADDYAQARILAQGLLADIGGNRTTSLRSRSGTDGRFAWAIDVTPSNATVAEMKGAWRMRNVRITVAWSPDRRIELDTLRLGPANDQ